MPVREIARRETYHPNNNRARIRIHLVPQKNQRTARCLWFFDRNFWFAFFAILTVVGLVAVCSGAVIAGVQEASLGINPREGWVIYMLFGGVGAMFCGAIIANLLEE